jgi:hypothetical protein
VMTMSPPLRCRVGIAVSVVILVPVLAGCSSTVALSPAPEANTVGCADVIVHLPKSVESNGLRDTNAQATAAWGSPASILLTCGITTPSVSDLPCYPVEGVDWLADQRGNDFVYTTYGRVPGVQVVVDTKAVPSSSNVLFDLSSAVGTLKQTGTCLGASDATGTPTP